jgi:hypothetical protein
VQLSRDIPVGADFVCDKAAQGEPKVHTMPVLWMPAVTNFVTMQNFYVNPKMVNMNIICTLSDKPVPILYSLS